MRDDTESVEHTIPVKAFVKMLKGTADEVYSRLLLISNPYQNKTKADWEATLHAHRGLEE